MFKKFIKYIEKDLFKFSCVNIITLNLNDKHINVIKNSFPLSNISNYILEENLVNLYKSKNKDNSIFYLLETNSYKNNQDLIISYDYIKLFNNKLKKIQNIIECLKPEKGKYYDFTGYYYQIEPIIKNNLIYNLYKFVIFLISLFNKRKSKDLKLFCENTKKYTENFYKPYILYRYEQFDKNSNIELLSNKEILFGLFHIAKYRKYL